MIPSKVPARVPVVGSDGELVVCANGERLMAPTNFGPPPVAAPVIPPLRQSSEPLVLRCGSGPNAHLNPVEFRISEDPLRKR